MGERGAPVPSADGDDKGATRGDRLRLPGGRRGGAHLTRSRGLVGTAHRAAVIGATALQMFTDNPTAWRRRAAPPDELPRFREALASQDVVLAIHASYLINLAGPDDALFRRSVALLRAELQAAPGYGATFVNVHVGSHRGSGPDAGFARVVSAIEIARRGVLAGVTLVLENGSGGGDQIGARLEDLAAILELAARAGVDDGLAFCLDTAHLWGAGYDISKAEGVDAVLATFGGSIGLERLAMVHVNDTLSPLASRHDRHTHLGDGEIGAEGLARFVTHPALDHVTFLTETPGTDEGLDAVNVGRMADMAAGRALRPMPAAEAVVKTAGPAATEVRAPRPGTNGAGATASKAARRADR